MALMALIAAGSDEAPSPIIPSAYDTLWGLASLLVLVTVALLLVALAWVAIRSVQVARVRAGDGPTV